MSLGHMARGTIKKDRFHKLSVQVCQPRNTITTVSHDEVEGEQNIPPQYVLLWHVYLFSVEHNQDPADSGRAFYLPLNCLKEFK